jgi:hypothetical protein
LNEQFKPGQPWAPHTVLPEPLLKFDNNPRPATASHPLLGLLEHGAYAGPPTERVRLATITLRGQQQMLYQFLKGVTQPHEPRDRRAYVPPFPGFGRLFDTDLLPEPKAHLDISSDVVGSGPDAHERLSEALARAVRHLHTIRDTWDVIVVLLPRAWEPLRRSSDGSLDLHDRLKVMAAPLGCPIQVIREDSALRFSYECSMFWRLSIALLTKAGGVPFRMMPPTPTDTAYLGLAYAIRGGTSNEFVTCCSQVFDGEGGGFEFIAYNIGADRDLHNPHLTREEMRTVMARSSRLYQRRRAGALPLRLVVHKTTTWHEDEVAGVFDAWGAAVPDIECLQVKADPPWVGVALGRDSQGGSRPDDWPVERGSLQYLSGREGLLWVSGTAPGVSLTGTKYNQAAKALPAPIAFRRESGSGPLEVPAAEILALSKLDWNNDALYGLTPVTIAYSQKLARLLSRAPHLPDDSYQFRLFM